MVIRRTTIQVVLSLAIAGSAAGQTEAVIERIVAVVGDEIILLSGLNDRIKPLMAQLARVPDPAMRTQRLKELQRQALDQIVDEKLIGQEARKLKLEVTDQELERAVADVMSKNSLTREQLEQALGREGKTLHAYKSAILRPQLLRLKVLNVTVRSRVSVSDDELRAKYQQNLRELGVETKLRARHIFITVPDGASPAQEAARRQVAAKLLAQIKQGADFAALARQHSEDAVTREEGGDLGFFGRGTLPPDVEDVVFKMKPQQVRGPLRTSRGFHLIQLTDRQESSARAYEEVREELRQQVYAEKLDKSTQAWLREVRKRTHIETKL